MACRRVFVGVEGHRRCAARASTRIIRRKRSEKRTAGNAYETTGTQSRRKTYTTPVDRVACETQSQERSREITLTLKYIPHILAPPPPHFIPPLHSANRNVRPIPTT